jgi:hypothetical protein
MRTEKEDSGSAKEVSFELKYCERCGGLWLRPAGGGQIYCAGCAREMKLLPAASNRLDSARVCEGPEWGGEPDGYEIYEGDEEIDLDAMGGVA